MLDAKSDAMVEKELALAVAAYSLTRAAMNQAASANRLPHAPGYVAEL